MSSTREPVKARRISLEERKSPNQEIFQFGLNSSAKGSRSMINLADKPPPLIGSPMSRDYTLTDTTLFGYAPIIPEVGPDIPEPRKRPENLPQNVLELLNHAPSAGVVGGPDKPVNALLSKRQRSHVKKKEALSGATGLAMPVKHSKPTQTRGAFEKLIRHNEKKFARWSRLFDLSTDFDVHARQVSEDKLLKTRGRISVDPARDCKIQDAVWEPSPGPYVNFGRVLQGSVVRFRIKVVNKSTRTFKKLHASLSGLPEFSLVYRPQAIAMGMTRTLVLSSDCTEPGEFTGSLDISTSPDGENLFSLPVYIKVADPAVTFARSSEASARDLLALANNDDVAGLRKSLVDLSIHADPVDTDSDSDNENGYA